MSRNVSARYALTDEQVQFCRRYKAGSGRDPERRKIEAYRQSFLLQTADGHWVQPNFDLSVTPKAQAIEKLRNLRKLPDRDILYLANDLLSDGAVADYLTELDQSSVLAAEGSLRETIQFGAASDARASAVKLLEREEKASRIDDIFYWAKVMDEAGAEIVVDLPVRAERDVTCTACGNVQHVSIPVEAVAPFPSLRQDD